MVDQIIDQSASPSESFDPRKRVLTGMRTTGKLHLGHYVGALQNWVDVQNSGKYDCYFLLADCQAATTHIKNPQLLTESVRDVTLDWLSVGLDPERASVNFVLQSQVAGRADLSLALMNIAPFAEHMRNPTLKAELGNQEDATVGFMVYPVDQIADISMVSPTPPEEGDEILVPVGEDQKPHLEYSRSIVRRFNKMFGPTIVPCKALIGDVGRLVGTDGQEKMGKSTNNAIFLTDPADVVDAKVKRMFTDPNRKTADTPGETENNPEFVYLRAFDPDKDQVAELTERYQQGKVGDVEVKRVLAGVLNEMLDPIRERRAKLENSSIRDYLEAGTEIASEHCFKVLDAVLTKMHLTYPS